MMDIVIYATCGVVMASCFIVIKELTHIRIIFESIFERMIGGDTK